MENPEPKTKGGMEFYPKKPSKSLGEVANIPDPKGGKAEDQSLVKIPKEGGSSRGVELTQ